MRRSWRLLWVGLSARAIGGFVTPGPIVRRLGLRSSSAISDLPKDETGVSELLRARPEADGRGVRVAVLDTGCDLAAAGLQTTSTGAPKYLDFIDCTGGGDIAMSPTNLTEDGRVIGLSGRHLQLGPWADEIKSFRRGAFRLWDVSPTSVLSRVKRERKEAFKAQQHQASTRLQHRLDMHARDGSTNETAKAAKKDLELQLKLLKEMMDAYDDAGPLLDVLLFEDAEGVQRAVVDTEGTGDLRLAAPMAPYKVESQVGEFGFGTALSFCVQVYDGGDLLSIVTDAGSHGTHVAGIVAAHFEDAPALNGVAPGAQILACKIGDERLQSAETGTGLIRALVAAKAAGCDLINLSYGESFYKADSGRVAAAFADAVRKWGMTVFTSAGNNGFADVDVRGGLGDEAEALSPSGPRSRRSAHRAASRRPSRSAHMCPRR